MSFDIKIPPDARTVNPGQPVGYHAGGVILPARPDLTAIFARLDALETEVAALRAAQAKPDPRIGRLIEHRRGEGTLYRTARVIGVEPKGTLRVREDNWPDGCSDEFVQPDGVWWVAMSRDEDRSFRAALAAAGRGDKVLTVFRDGPEDERRGAVETEAVAPVAPCSSCGNDLLFSARQRGDGLCGPCSRVANGEAGAVDLVWELRVALDRLHADAKRWLTESDDRANLRAAEARIAKLVKIANRDDPAGVAKQSKPPRAQCSTCGEMYDLDARSRGGSGLCASCNGQTLEECKRKFYDIPPDRWGAVPGDLPGRRAPVDVEEFHAAAETLRAESEVVTPLHRALTDPPPLTTPRLNLLRLSGPDLATAPPGLYELHWKVGGSALAAVGLFQDGRHWFAPCNWAIGVPSVDWALVEAATVVRLQEGKS